MRHNGPKVLLNANLPVKILDRTSTFQIDNGCCLLVIPRRTICVFAVRFRAAGFTAVFTRFSAIVECIY